MHRKTALAREQAGHAAEQAAVSARVACAAAEEAMALADEVLALTVSKTCMVCYDEVADMDSLDPEKTKSAFAENEGVRGQREAEETRQRWEDAATPRMLNHRYIAGQLFPLKCPRFSHSCAQQFEDFAGCCALGMFE